MPFYMALEVEIGKAELAGKSLNIIMDLKSKSFRKNIPNTIHGKSPNISLLARKHVLNKIFKRHSSQRALIRAEFQRKC